MTRKHTLIDYANLGANLIQAAQLTEMRRCLDNQSQLAVMELAIDESQAKLRESIFQADTLLKSLEAAHARDENVVGLLALARESVVNLKQNPISHLLRSYEDKERIRAVIEGFEALIKRCTSPLSPVDREQAELCANYRLEESDVDRAIYLKEIVEQFDEARVKLQELEVQIAPAKRAKAVATVGLLAVLAGIIFIGYAISDDAQHPLLRQLSYWLIGIGAGVAALAGLVFAARYQKHQLGDDPELGKEALSRKIFLFETALIAGASKAEAPNSWENKPLAELRQIREERASFVSKVLKSGPNVVPSTARASQ